MDDRERELEILRRRLAVLTEEARKNDDAWRRAQAREMELLVTELGLDPLEAISCATRNGAIALRRPLDSIGVITTGAAADVLVVDGDPTDDIGVLGDRPW